MNEDANSQTFEQATTPNESPTPAPLTEAAILEPLRGVVITLSNRLDDAMSKQRQFQNEAHDLRLQLQRTEEAAEYHGKRAAAIQRRIVTSRDAIRAWEDEQAIVV